MNGTEQKQRATSVQQLEKATEGAIEALANAIQRAFASAHKTIKTHEHETLARFERVEASHDELAKLLLRSRQDINILYRSFWGRFTWLLLGR